MSPKEKQKIDISAAKKILLVRLRRIGDIVMTTPAITALHQGLPTAEISYVVEKPYQELLEGNPSIERIFVLPRPLGLKKFRQTIQAFRKERFDVAIDFHGGPTASLLTLFSGAEQKIGYRIKYKSFIYDIAIPRGARAGHIHSVENHVNLVRALGMRIPVSPPLFLPEPLESEKKKIHDFFSRNDLTGSEVVVVHMGAGNKFREWGANKWAKFISIFIERQDLKIIMIGAPRDAAAADRILSDQRSSVFSLAGKLNLRELKELIAKSRLYVGPDSGPMHIAASTATPIVALFGPNLSAYNAPWQSKSIIIEKNMDCRPCDQRNCLTGDYRCMKTITPEEVYAACASLLPQ